MFTCKDNLNWLSQSEIGTLATKPSLWIAQQFYKVYQGSSGVTDRGHVVEDAYTGLLTGKLEFPAGVVDHIEHGMIARGHCKDSPIVTGAKDMVYGLGHSIPRIMDLTGGEFTVEDQVWISHKGYHGINFMSPCDYRITGSNGYTFLLDLKTKNKLPTETIKNKTLSRNESTLKNLIQMFMYSMGNNGSTEQYLLYVDGDGGSLLHKIKEKDYEGGTGRAIRLYIKDAASNFNEIMSVADSPEGLRSLYRRMYHEDNIAGYWLRTYWSQRYCNALDVLAK